MPRLCKHKREQGWVELDGEMISVKVPWLGGKAHDAAFDPCGACYLTLTLFIFLLSFFIFFYYFFILSLFSFSFLIICFFFSLFFLHLSLFFLFFNKAELTSPFYGRLWFGWNC